MIQNNFSFFFCENQRYGYNFAIESSKVSLQESIYNLSKQMIAEEITQIKVQPAPIANQQRLARKTNKILQWLRLLSMHRQNKNYSEMDRLISEDIHENFVMQQSFWLEYIDTRTQNDCSKAEVQVMMLALEDGPYFMAAGKIIIAIVDMFNRKVFKPNYCLSIIEKVISSFQFDKKNGSQFYKILRSIYSSQEDTVKIRSSFQRELKCAFDDHDITYDQYLCWQKSTQNLQKMQKIYNETKDKWQREKIQFDETNTSRFNVRKTLLNLQDENKSVIDAQIYNLFLNLLSSQQQKLWFLRRLALKFRTHWIQDYLNKVELFYSNDEQKIIKKYKIGIRLSSDQNALQKKLLSYLIKRINKHLTDSQMPQQYYDSWGNKIVQFRQTVTELIQKQRKFISLEQKNKIFLDFYSIWIEVEQKIVKDKASICQLYQNLVSNQQNMSYYENYANSLTALGAINDAKNILKRYLKHEKGNKSRQAYRKFLNLYGSLQDQISFNQEIKQQVKKQKQEIENLVLKDLQILKIVATQVQNDKPLKNQKEIAPQQSAQEKNPNKRPHPSIQDEVQEKIQSATRKRLHVDGQHTLYIKGIPLNWKEKDVMNILSYASNVVRVSLITKNNEQRDYCYIEYDSKEAAEKQVTANKSEYQFFISKPPSQYDESKSIFVCALPQTSDQQKIRMIFQSFSEYITEIRLKIKKDKNFAYVDFDTQEHKNQAFEQLHKKSLQIDGKKILLQHCDSHRQKTKKFVQVVFLKNLPFKANQEDVVSFFSGKQISKISIPLHLNNKPKGFAYVQFVKFKDYQDALDLRKGQLFGRQFMILKSDREITQRLQQNHKNTQSHTSKQKQDPKRESSSKFSGRKKQSEGQKSKSEERDNNFFSKLFK